MWDKLFRNQQSQTVLEKFIHNILMYLQILILALLILSLMSPYLHRAGKSRGNVILVFDTSGSMQHDAGDGGTRLEWAIKEAESLIASSEETAFSIITCDCTGTDPLAVGVKDKSTLLEALGQITCCDGGGDLSDAQSMVETFRNAGGGSEEGSQAAEVIVFTDGGGAAEAMHFSEYFDAQVVVVGEAVSNVANQFLSFAEGDAGMITCASGITNYSDAKASMEVSLYAGERLVEIKKMTLAAEESALCFFEDFPWQGEVLRSEISSVRFAGREDKDSLAGDNTAYAIGEQTGSVDAVLIGEGNTYIEKAYAAAFGRSLTKVKGESALPGAIPEAGAESVQSGAVAETGSSDTLQGAQARTVRIYDAGAENSLRDGGNSLVFQDESLKAGTAEKVMLSVTDCELTEGLSSFSIGVNETNVYEVPSWGTGFLWAGSQCAGYYGEHDGIRAVVVGFDIRESDFPLKAEFPVFMANAVRFLGDTSLLAENIYEAGDALLFHPLSDFDVSTLHAETKKAGLYEVTAGELSEQYVVRFATEEVSDGRIRAEGTVSEAAYSSQLVRVRLRNVLLVLALILMIAEWVLYVRQMR